MSTRTVKRQPSANSYFLDALDFLILWFPEFRLKIDSRPELNIHLPAAAISLNFRLATARPVKSQILPAENPGSILSHRKPFLFKLDIGNESLFAIGPVAGGKPVHGIVHLIDCRLIHGQLLAEFHRKNGLLEEATYRNENSTI
jgi:hypothetical protein